MVPVSAGKIFIAHNIAKALFSIIVVEKTCTFYLALSPFHDITSVTYFEF